MVDDVSGKEKCIPDAMAESSTEPSLILYARGTLSTFWVPGSVQVLRIMRMRE